MLYIAFLLALIVGILMGLVGGGGSILTVPIFVYLFSWSPLVATSASLLVVGCTALVGGLNYKRKGYVDIKAICQFGIASIVTVFITRKYLIHLVPQVIFQFKEWTLTKDVFLMLLFAALMIVAGIAMIKNTKRRTGRISSANDWASLGWGAIVGVVTGLLGAGGGFLIVPALHTFLKLPIKKAIGSSLWIISINSLFGFSLTVTSIEYNWVHLLVFTFLSIVGIKIGGRFVHRISPKSLKKGFGYFILIMAVFILLKEIK